MHNEYCTDISFNFLVIKDTFDYKKYKGSWHNLINENIFESDFSILLDSINLKITWAELFYLGPSSIKDFAIHTDNAGGDYVKLNWVFGGENSKMQWYTVKEGVVKVPNKTAIGSVYLAYNSNELDLVHQQSVKQPSIVQVGIPHNLYNPETDAFCLSIVLRDKTTDIRLTMQQALQLFKNYII
jgi:hypothetical protein